MAAKNPTGQAPSDLPDKYRWAADEIVALRLRNLDLETAAISQQAELEVRVAQALYRTYADVINRIAGQRSSWEDIDPKSRDYWLTEARAVISGQ